MKKNILKIAFLFTIAMLFASTYIHGETIRNNSNNQNKTTEGIIDYNEFAVDSKAKTGYTKQIEINYAKELTMITHSNSQSITAANSAACSNEGLHTDNSYYRAFDLSAFDITTDWLVERIDIGIENATASGATQPVSIILHTASSTNLNTATLTQIYSENFNFANATAVVHEFMLSTPVLVPQGSILAIEFFTPNGQDDGHAFFIGSNNLGQTADSFIKAADCGLNAPTTTQAIGFPGMQIVMNVWGMEPQDAAELIIEDVAGDAGAAVTVPVNAVNINDLVAFQWTIEYDNTLLEFVNCTNWAAGVNTDELLVTDFPAEGKITFVYEYTNLINIEDGKFFDLNFNVKPGVEGLTNIEWSGNPTEQLLVNSSPAVINADWIDGSVDVELVELFEADFGADITTACVGADVVFTDLSTGTTGSTTYSWNFGAGADPATAAGVGPHTVSYTTAGQKTASLTISDDGNNDTEEKANYINVDEASVGGTVAGGGDVCTGSTSDELTLSGHTGDVVRWQSSTNEGGDWTDITNTTATFTSGALTQTTWFRAVVKSGVCAEANSAHAVVTVSPQSVGGTVAGGSTICSGSTSEELTLSGHTGDIVKWQSSTNEGGDWTDITHTTATFTSGALTQTTWFRAVVKSGACPPAESEHTVIEVDPMTVGGEVTGGDDICLGFDAPTLTLENNVGDILRWESSSTSDGPWTTVEETTETYEPGAITETTWFRAVVKSGVCILQNSDHTVVNVNPVPDTSDIIGDANPDCEAVGETYNVTLTAGSTYAWTVPTGATITDGETGPGNNEITVTFAENNGFIEVIETNTHGCTGDKKSLQIAMVGCALVANFSADPLEICAGETVTFTDLSTGSVTDWTWNFGEGADPVSATTQGPHIVTYNTSGLKAVSLKVEDGISDDIKEETDYITAYESVGGTVAGGSTICSGSTSGVLTISGHTGDIVKWQSSTDEGDIWTDIAHTDATYTSAALTQTTWFRAVLKDGLCDEVESDHAVVTVNPQSVGGTVAGGSTICSGSTSGTLTLSGHTGDIIKWQSSTNEGGAWTDITNTTATHTSGAITQTTWFRAVVKSGDCPEANSSHAVVTVSPQSDGGTVAGGSTICSGSTSEELTLSGHTGDIVKWQSSTNEGSDWTDIAHTTATFTSGALTQTTWFRAVVKSGACPEANSAHTVVTVIPASVGGTIAGGSTICSGSTSGTLTLSGHTGDIVKWQLSTNDGDTWTDITHTTATYTSGELTETTWYRAVVKSGDCPEAKSDHAVVNVAPQTVGGTVTGGSAVCSGLTSGVLTLSGYTGDVVKWQSSVDEGDSWTDIAHTEDTYTSGALTQTIWFRAVVKSGVCDEENSSHTVVSIAPPTVGGEVAGGSTVCVDSDSGVLTLSGHTGSVVKWQASINEGTSWTDITHTEATYTSGALKETTWYRAEVQSGNCDTEFSDYTIVEVDQTSVGGTIAGGDEVCSGDNSGVLTLSGHIGDVVKWQSSVDEGDSWTDITHTEDTYTSGVLTQAKWFRAVVKNGVCAEAFSQHLEIDVISLTEILTHPEDTNVCAGDDVTFTVSATGENLSYQWYLNDVVIAGANSNTYTITNVDSSDQGDYYCEVTGDCGVVDSDEATLTIEIETEITEHPENVAVNEGQTATFTVEAVGADLTYQWRKNEVDLSDDSSISGSNTETLTISNTTEPNAGLYDVVIVGTCGSEISNEAELSIITDIIELSDLGLSIYPNPSEGLFVVELNEYNKPLKVIVTDIGGKTVYQGFLNEKSSRIDLSNQKAGIYNLMILSEDQPKNIRIVISK